MNMGTNKGFFIVTGASSGIGRSIAEQLAVRGENLIITVRREKELRTLAEQLESRYAVRIEPIPADLTTPGGVEGFLTRLEKSSIKGLINNAGFGFLGSFTDRDARFYEQMIGLNILAVIKLTRAVIPFLEMNGGGHIMNVASTAAFQTGPYFAVYAATKAFVLSFSEALHVELKPKGILVTCLCPGPTQSAFFDVAGNPMSDRFVTAFKATSESVAGKAVHAMLRGRAVKVTGIMNFIISQLSRFVPRSITRKVSAVLLRPK